MLAKKAVGSAEHQGRLWGSRARDWADYGEPTTQPLFVAVLDALAFAPGTRYLDVGCGAGLACRMAADRGARVSGLDAARELVEIARDRVRDADIRVGEMEELPYGDASFDVVTGFNSFQFASDRVRALAEARRVIVSGGTLGFGVWGMPEDCQAQIVIRAMFDLMQAPSGDAPAHVPLATPGVLPALLESAGWRPRPVREVECPFVFPDLDTAQRAFLSPGPVSLAIMKCGEPAVRARLAEAFSPFRSRDGGYRLENRFIFVLADAP